jgi:CubicO group peptidase (beta-lactamase class C family)
MAHKTAEFDQLVERLMEEWHAPGLSIAVVQGDQIDAKVNAILPSAYKQSH